MGVMYLGKDIQQAAQLKGIDPYNTPFRPRDLGLYGNINGNVYGNFSVWCSAKQTTSGKYNHNVCLKVVKWNSGGRPYKYVLLPESEWLIEE